MQRIINEKLAYIAEHINEHPTVNQISVSDERKSGWAIVEVPGVVKKISAADEAIVMADGNSVVIRDIIYVSVK